MKRFFRTKLPALALALALMVSALPMANALEWIDASPSCPHTRLQEIVSQTPTCSTPGFKIYQCLDCNGYATEQITVSHNYSRYSYNATYHWKVCSVCGAQDTASKEEHIDRNDDGRCDVCLMSYGGGSGSSSSSRGDITYNVSPGSRVSLDEKDFYDFFYNNTTSGNLRYVIFDRPSSSAFSEGTLYYDYGGKNEIAFSRSTLASGTFYYGGSYDEDREEYDLDDLTFVADRDFEDEISLSFRAYYTSSRYVDGTVTISPSKSSSSSKVDITYEVAPGSKVNLDEDDFDDFFRDSYPNYRLDHVVFERPSSSAFSEGTLYYDYGGKNEIAFSRSTLASGTFYYGGSYDEDREEYDLDDLTFVAERNFEDDVTLSFRAYYSSSRYVDGTLTITSTKSSSSTKADITYQVEAGSRVNLDEEDFYDFFDDNSSTGSLRYVVFDRPDSSAFSEGTLYYDYGSKNEIAFSRSTLASGTFYYGGGYDDPDREEYDLDDLTFVADRDFEDDVILTFRAYYSSSRYVDGTLLITTGKSSSKPDFSYEVAPGSKVDLDEDDFYDFFDDNSSTGSLRYVVFDRPDTSAFADGGLYYDYGGRDQTLLTRTSLSSYVFYYDYDYDDDDSDVYDLDNLTFVADRDFKDDVTLTFRAYYSSSRYVDGTLTITAGKNASASTVSGDIRYAATYGSKVQINANDIARYFNKSYPGYTLQYVSLGGVPSTGALYYNYYGASKYGTSYSMQLTSANYNSQVLYFSPVSTAQFALTELTYVPSGNNYCVTIPFTAYGSGSRSVSGNILISVNSTTVSEVYGVTQRNTAVTFPAGSIYSAVSAATGVSLSGIQLLSLPTASQGTVYVGSGSTRATTNTLYTYGSGTQQISQLRFVPTSTFTGSVQIPYVAYNSSGTAFATGLFSLGVLNNAKSFRDVSSSTWCYKYVVELSDANVIDGYADGSFKPDNTVTYGAALKLIMLAAGYPEQAPVNSNVFSGYLAKAQADGIITRSDVDLSKPITRLQVAQIAAGAMKLDTSNLSSVQPFTDTTDASVRALNAAGIVEGYFSNGTSTYRPNNTLTRGQLSAIVWRMQQYGK